MSDDGWAMTDGWQMTANSSGGARRRFVLFMTDRCYWGRCRRIRDQIGIHVVSAVQKEGEAGRGCRQVLQKLSAAAFASGSRKVDRKKLGCLVIINTDDVSETYSRMQLLSTTFSLQCMYLFFDDDAATWQRSHRKQYLFLFPVCWLATATGCRWFMARWPAPRATECCGWLIHSIAMTNIEMGK